MLERYNLKNYNFKLLIMVIIAVIMGTIAINSANPTYLNKQIFGICLFVAIIISVSLISYDFICKFYIAFYFINILLLILVLLVGKEVNNATRWIEIGGFTFQPSELAKILIIIFLSVVLDKLVSNNKLNSFKSLIFIAISVAIPLFLIFKEPDLSTTICITTVIVSLVYVSGLSHKIIGLILLVTIPLFGTFIWYIQTPNQGILEGYQVNRILSFIYPSKYGENMAQTNNSIMAIGSGQLYGKGLTNSTIASVKDANFISEQETDFIFSIIGEEVGFVGSVFVIAILLLIVLQCIKVARRAKDTKGMLIATGLGCLIGFQAFINIAVTTGVLPNTGIPLPFISYGLSSLISFSIGIGMVLNISLQGHKY